MMTAFSRVTFLILTLVLPLATPFWASAQETITITEGSVEPTPIAIANLPALMACRAMLAGRLLR